MKVFISHTAADKDLATRIGRSLRATGVDVWFDKWKVYAGDSLTEVVAKGIQECRAVVVLLSPAAVNSRWVREELRLAAHRRLDDPLFVVVPIIVAPCDIPAFLQDLRYIEWHKQPSAAGRELHATIRRLTAPAQTAGVNGSRAFARPVRDLHEPSVSVLRHRTSQRVNLDFLDDIVRTMLYLAIANFRVPPNDAKRMVKSIFADTVRSGIDIADIDRLLLLRATGEACRQYWRKKNSRRPA